HRRFAHHPYPGPGGARHVLHHHRRRARGGRRHAVPAPGARPAGVSAAGTARGIAARRLTVYRCRTGRASRPVSRTLLMQNVFITGASSGLGRALARRYAQAGARLGLVARRGDALRELAASLPGRHHCYALDVRDRAALHAAAHDFIGACDGRVDVVIASARISAGTLTEHSEDFDVFQAIVATNLLATVATFEPFIAPMREAG